MDYTKQKLAFKLKKVIRYLRLYGPARTLSKVRAQYHMTNEFPQTDSLPPPAHATGKHVGLLGCGKFAYSNIAYYVRKNYGNVIRGVMDVDLNRAVSLATAYKADYYTTNSEAILNDPHIDLVYIASNHASHADYAIKAIERGKAVHIEKPHAVTHSQLLRLCEAISQHRGVVRLGFNRPDSTLGLLLRQHFDRQPGPSMINWFVAGHEIEPDHWYFSEQEGGRILGNLCHWIDFTLRLIPAAGRFPVQIIPARAGQSDCDISVSYIFADGSIATITFSAKGHTFEGVRETLNAHKGNVLANLTDFSELRIDLVEKVIRKRLLYRDHGHERAVTNSYRMLTEPSLAEPVGMVWASGYLTLKTKEALDSFSPITVDAYSPVLPAQPVPFS